MCLIYWSPVYTHFFIRKGWVSKFLKKYTFFALKVTPFHTNLAHCILALITITDRQKNDTEAGVKAIGENQVR